MGLKEPNDPAWYGLVAPAGTPDDVIAKLNAAAVKALQDKDFVQRLRTAGAEPSGNTPAQHAAEIKRGIRQDEESCEGAEHQAGAVSTPKWSFRATRFSLPPSVGEGSKPQDRRESA